MVFSEGTGFKVKKLSYFLKWLSAVDSQFISPKFQTDIIAQTCFTQHIMQTSLKEMPDRKFSVSNSPTVAWCAALLFLNPPDCYGVGLVVS